jgi:RNA polymerase sigma-70 factor (ECF subfamily)
MGVAMADCRDAVLRPLGEPLAARSSHLRSASSEERIHFLIAKARAGDRSALGEIYERYADTVFRCVYRIIQDPHEAEDITQQVFLKLMSVLPKYQRRQVPFSAWLMRVARNAARDVERKRRPMQVEAAPDPGWEPDYDFHRGRSLRAALDALPDSQRRVVVLRHIVGLSAGEVAERLDKTPGSIHALDQRGRRALKGDLAERAI